MFGDHVCDTDVRDGNFEVRSRAQSEGTHGQRGGSSCGSNQLNTRMYAQDSFIAFVQTNFSRTEFLKFNVIIGGEKFSQ